MEQAGELRPEGVASGQRPSCNPYRRSETSGRIAGRPETPLAGTPANLQGTPVEAIRKATERAKRGMIRVPMKEGRTLHHDIEGRYGAGKVVLRTAVAGTGIIAGGPLRAVFETLGIGDVVAKSLGSRNPHNMVKAAFAALERCASPRSVANRRGKKVSELFARREAPPPPPAAPEETASA